MLDQPRKGRKKEALNLPNALRPDCPSRKFQEQQNYSEYSEDPEDPESTEGTESAEETDAPVSEPSSDRYSGRVGIPACPVESTGR